MANLFSTKIGLQYLFTQLLHAGGVSEVDALLGVVGRRSPASFDAEGRRLASQRVLRCPVVEQLVLGNDTSGSRDDKETHKSFNHSSLQL